MVVGESSQWLAKGGISMLGNQGVELTWPGKDDSSRVSEASLVLEKAHCYGDSSSDNMLIHGDNLAALEVLAKRFNNQIKCTYIDPPYNTGNAFGHYEDNLHHASWLSFMQPRLQLLRSLLRKDGVIFISIDDDEMAYLKILCDQVFGRANYCGAFVWEKKKKPSFLTKIASITEYVLAYAKQRELAPDFVYGETTQGKKYPLNNAGNGVRRLVFPAKSVYFKIKDQIVEPQDMSSPTILTRLLNPVRIENGVNANQFVLEGEWRYSQTKLDEVIGLGDPITISRIPFRPNHVRQGGAPKKMKNLLSVAHYGLPTYEDATKESIALFGADSFSYPKPEKLISLLLSAVTKPGDIVLDAFVGSGTTIAAAHKLSRRWIGIEVGKHCYTHCIPRMKKVISGFDPNGITKETKWRGGGGYQFYELIERNKDQ